VWTPESPWARRREPVVNENPELIRCRLRSLRICQPGHCACMISAFSRVNSAPPLPYTICSRHPLFRRTSWPFYSTSWPKLGHPIFRTVSSIRPSVVNMKLHHHFEHLLPPHARGTSPSKITPWRYLSITTSKAFLANPMVTHACTS
jgi:hypothetical protein